MATTAYSVGGTATELANENRNRIALIIDNQGPDVLYLGDATTLTVANGITVKSDGKYVMDMSAANFEFFYRGDVYGISAGTSDVRVWEITDVRI